MLQNYKEILEKSRKHVFDLAQDILTSYAINVKMRISNRSLNIVKLAYFAQKGGKLKL